jgi:heptosyltransferase II
MLQRTRTAATWLFMTSKTFIRLPNYIGDAVMALPAIEHLQQAGFAPHLLGKGWIDDLFSPFDWPRTVLPKAIADQAKLLRSLRNDAPAGGMLLTNSLSSAFAFWRAGIAATGYAKEMRSVLLKRAVPLDDSLHQAQQYLTLAVVMTGRPARLPPHIDWPVAPDQLQAADDLLAGHGVSAPFVIVCPFAGGNFRGREKIWPAFPAFITALLDSGVSAVCCPGPAEAAVAHALDSRLRVIEDTTLSRFIAIAARSQAVVSNDSGPAHLAAAGGAYVISVMRWQDQIDTVRPLARSGRVLFTPDAWPTVDDALRAVRQRV